MLTLQQLLESDSIATLVAKLNNNFQTISASNGGPQGIRGSQGIPGLPGKRGPQGSTGPQGDTGTITGVIPFSSPNDSGTAGVGPTAGTYAPNGQEVSPWPYSSWYWLQYYHTPGGTGFTGSSPRHGDIYLDHGNEGYWKYLQYEDEPGADDGSGGYTGGGYYYYNSTTSGVTYPDLGSTGGWGGTGWYFYPTPQATTTLSNMWEADYTTYFAGPTASGPYPYGPSTDNSSSDLKIPNARLTTKYGTVWITTGSDSTPSAFDNDDNWATESIGRWGLNADPAVYTPPAPRPGRYNSGVDRLLFKMSLDNLPYLSNITARGWTAGTSGPAFVESGSYPTDSLANQMINEDFWAKPQYQVTMDKFSPLLYLSERTDGGAVNIDYFSSLGLYMHTADDTPIGATGEGLHKSLFLWSSRAALDPLQMYSSGTPIDSTSTDNYGEFVLDFRRLITSNQYVCSVPSDMRLSSEIVHSGAYVPGDSATLAFRVFSGYISAINGKAMTGDPTAGDYWEYGLGQQSPSSYSAIGGTHDPASGTAGMYTRTNWYGSAVLSEKPSNWENLNPGSNDYIRVAGMLERGRRIQYSMSFDDTNNYLSELIFYTSQFTLDNSVSGFNPVYGPSNDLVDPTTNAHRSLPSLYISPYRNIGIGTFVGGEYALNDQGPLEPASHFQVHTKVDTNLSLFEVIASSSGYTGPQRVFKTAAFSGEHVSGTGSSVLVHVGSLTSPSDELVEPTFPAAVNKFVGSLNSGFRADRWPLVNLSSFRIGTKGSISTDDLGTYSVDAGRSEFQLHLSPLNKNATVNPTQFSRNIVGLGVHNFNPQARVHFFGDKGYNPVEVGYARWTPGTIVAGGSGTIQASYPYYTLNSLNPASANQVFIDYINANAYIQPVGIKDYQYYTYGTFAGTGSTNLYTPNSSAYPNKETLSPTRTGIPYTPGDSYLGYPAALGLNKHGGVQNAWFEPSSYIGFNIFRDNTSADQTGGESLSSSNWRIGTQGNNAANTNGNNGAAAFIFSPQGELGLVTIPSGRDGGRAYTGWEQGRLGTRDVLNQMKVIFDSGGNIGIGNAPGVDLDAYPSQERDKNSGELYYVPRTGALTTGPVGASVGAVPPLNITYWGTSGQYGRIGYTAQGSETLANSTAATINKRATNGEYVRLEVAAEKAHNWNGRSAFKVGWGYPTSTTLTIPAAEAAKYIRTNAPITGIVDWQIKTDWEGRITKSVIKVTASAPPTQADFDAIVYPHPTEFSPGGPLAATPGIPVGWVSQPGALAAEWYGTVIDPIQLGYQGSSTTVGISATTPAGTYNCSPVFTQEVMGLSNMRLNNYVFAEGYSFEEGDGQTAGNGQLTSLYARAGRQASPKLIFTFLEATPTAAETAQRSVAGNDPYKKVNTVVMSAQNKASLREYWIPKADETGGTFMTFTDHMGSKEFEDGIDRQLTSGTGYKANGTGATGNIQKLFLTQVITAEVVMGHTAEALGDFISNRENNIIGLSGGSSGEVRSTNILAANTAKRSLAHVNYVQTFRASSSLDGGTGTIFAPGVYGVFANVSPSVSNSTLYGPSGTNAFNGMAAGAAPIPQVASVIRNLDEYYAVWEGVTASYGATGLYNDINGWPSKATEIRFKRINSEFVFVDFNITVEVKNPRLPANNNYAANTFRELHRYIDHGVPRMTQALTFVFNPDQWIESYAPTNNNNNDATEAKYGGGPWFHMWSGYRNWLPGSAVVGDETLDLSNTNPAYTQQYSAGGEVIDSPTWVSSTNYNYWNGNILAPGYFDFTTTANPLQLGSNGNFAFNNTPAGNENLGGAGQNSGIHTEFLNSIINSQISYTLFGANLGDFDNELKRKGYSFMYHIPLYSGMWGAQTMSRTKNFSWRMVPTRWVDRNTGASVSGATNNALQLEIQFNEPILHVDHEFLPTAFNTYGNAAATVTPYKYLTLSGQGIIRYGKTTIGSGVDEV